MALDNTMDTGVTALEAGITEMEVIANNIANLDSIGFKKSTTLKTDNFYRTLQQSAGATSAGGFNSVGMQAGTGTSVSSINRDFKGGSMKSTNILTHLAIQDGGGMFKVMNSANGAEFATRRGDFILNNQNVFVLDKLYTLQGAIMDPTFEPTYAVTYVNGQLVYTMDATSGTAAAPTLGALGTAYKLKVGAGTPSAGTGGLTVDRGASSSTAVPASITDAEIEQSAPRVQSFSFSTKGELQITLSDGSTFTRGQVLLMTFQDSLALMEEGSGLYTGFSAASVDTFSYAGSKPGEGARGKIKQGFLEASNVDLTEQFTKLIGTQKYVQAATRIITTANAVLDEIINIKR